MGMLPDSLKQCKLYGIEIDGISGRIARQLYQKNTIAVKAFQDVELIQRKHNVVECTITVSLESNTWLGVLECHVFLIKTENNHKNMSFKITIFSLISLGVFSVLAI